MHLWEFEPIQLVVGLSIDVGQEGITSYSGSFHSWCVGQGLRL